MRRLPPSTQKQLIKVSDQVGVAVQPYRDLLQQHLWDRIGWKAKPTKPKVPPAYCQRVHSVCTTQ